MREYDVVVNGHKTRMQLSDEDAKRLGVVRKEPEPAEDDQAEAKQRTPENKSRTARNK